jgi:hypothetical protein
MRIVQASSSSDSEDDTEAREAAARARDGRRVRAVCALACSRWCWLCELRAAGCRAAGCPHMHTMHAGTRRHILSHTPRTQHAHTKTYAHHHVARLPQCITCCAVVLLASHMFLGPRQRAGVSLAIASRAQSRKAHDASCVFRLTMQNDPQTSQPLWVEWC